MARRGWAGGGILKYELQAQRDDLAAAITLLPSCGGRIDELHVGDRFTLTLAAPTSWKSCLWYRLVPDGYGIIEASTTRTAERMVASGSQVAASRSQTSADAVCEGEVVLGLAAVREDGEPNLAQGLILRYFSSTPGVECSAAMTGTELACADVWDAVLLDP